jgi:hypothetical protein
VRNLSFYSGGLRRALAEVIVLGPAIGTTELWFDVPLEID